MKNNKGITLTSLVIYIALIFVVLAILMRITLNFSNNMQDVADVSFETEFNKLNLYLLDETKKTGNTILEISADGTQITFSKGNRYNYNTAEKNIYLNNTIKICEGVENCLFEKKIADNGKSILSLTVKINNIEKIANYVVTEKKETTNTTLLPNEYQQVEYIESTGTQYINTLYIPNSNTSIEMKASNTSTINTCLYCARTALNTGNYYTAFLINGTSLRIDYNTTKYDNIMTVTNDTTYVYKQYKNLVYIDGKLVKILTQTYFSSEYNMYLMASHEKGSNITNIGNIKLYYCKIWDGETLVRDLIPCYRKSDNVVGLYDTVNDVFYTNTGTGTFEKGDNVFFVADNGNQDYINEEDYIIGSVEEDNFEGLYQQVEYIESSGIQYIDTGFIPSSNTSIEMRASNTSTTNACLYCARGTSGNKDKTYTAFLINGTSLRVDYYDTAYDNVMTATRDTSYVYKQNKNVVYVDGELVKTLTVADFSSEYNMYLMASHRGEAELTNIGNVKLYYCKIWDGETIVRDFIPCYRKSDSVAGLYDTVNDVFYTNAGTGTFITGPM